MLYDFQHGAYFLSYLHIYTQAPHFLSDELPVSSKNRDIMSFTCKFLYAYLLRTRISPLFNYLIIKIGKSNINKIPFLLFHSPYSNVNSWPSNVLYGNPHLSRLQSKSLSMATSCQTSVGSWHLTLTREVLPVL